MSTGLDSFQNERCQLKNKKLDLWLGPWGLTPSYSLDLGTLGPCNWPTEAIKNSCLHMFFKIGNHNILQYSIDITWFGVSALLWNTSGDCFWQSYHGKVKAAGVTVLSFCATLCFPFWSKSYTNHCTNNCLLSHYKTISSLFELIDHMLLISEFVLEKQLLSKEEFWKWKMSFRKK